MRAWKKRIKMSYKLYFCLSENGPRDWYRLWAARVRLCLCFVTFCMSNSELSQSLHFWKIVFPFLRPRLNQLSHCYNTSTTFLDVITSLSLIAFKSVFFRGFLGSRSCNWHSITVVYYVQLIFPPFIIIWEENHPLTRMFFFYVFPTW